MGLFLFILAILILVIIAAALLISIANSFLNFDSEEEWKEFHKGGGL